MGTGFTLGVSHKGDSSACACVIGQLGLFSSGHSSQDYAPASILSGCDPGSRVSLSHGTMERAADSTCFWWADTRAQCLGDLTLACDSLARELHPSFQCCGRES